MGATPGRGAVPGDFPTHFSQFHSATFQPGPAGPYRNPSSAPSNVVEAPSTSHPRSIGELAEIAKQSLGDDARPFKTWLRIAENARRDAKSFLEQGDIESAFIEYTKAATIALERIPSHSDYKVLLSTTQRRNMGLHGQEMLDSLTDLKITIIGCYKQWQTDPSSVRVESQYSPASNPSPQLSLRRSVYSDETNTLSTFSTRSSPWICASIRSWSRELPPYDQSPHHHGQSSIADLPQFSEELGTILTGSSPVGTGTVSLESFESSISTVLPDSPPEIYILPPSRSPSPSPDISAGISLPPVLPLPYIPPPSSSSNPSPTRRLGRHRPKFSLPPPQMPKPLQGTYQHAVRDGFWNRRGDHLTRDKWVVYAPQGRTFPPDLENYPPPIDGFMDHFGHFIRYDPMLEELPESLPRQGQPPLLPYDKFVTFVYL